MNPSYYKAIYQIITTGHMITHQVGQELKEFGVTEPQFNVLRILKGARGKPVSVQEILGKMVQRNSNVTRIVDKLLAKGCVERHQCPDNRRKMDITITDTGLALLEQLNKKVETLHQPIMNNLSNEELETLEQLINKLKSNINAQANPGLWRKQQQTIHQ